MALILASASPYRLMLLQQVFIHPDKIFPCNIDESVLPREKPKDYVKRIAHAKANLALEKNPDDIILAADTIIVMGLRIFQKPLNREESKDMLNSFSGRRQQVYSYVVVKDKNRTVERFASTRISMKRLSDQDIIDNLNSNQWKSTSGGLCIEKFAGKLIKSVNGSYSNIMGLPLFETCSLLESFGIRSQVTES
ncbi:MAG: nucleoside triphosphate pyrophosphatase [Alphaproteobacteria bacterium]